MSTEKNAITEEEMISFKELFDINKLHGKVADLKKDLKKATEELRKEVVAHNNLKNLIYDFGKDMHCPNQNPNGSFNVCHTCPKHINSECSHGMVAVRFMDEGEPRLEETKGKYDWD